MLRQGKPKDEQEWVLLTKDGQRQPGPPEEPPYVPRNVSFLVGRGRQLRELGCLCPACGGVMAGHCPGDRPD